MKRVSPTVFLGIAVSLTAIMLVWLVRSSYRAHHESEVMEKRARRIDELDSLRAHRNETLSMSVHLAAVTGDQRWIRHYHEIEPKLRAAIEESIALAPESYLADHDADAETSRKVVTSLEHQVLALVGQGRLAMARSTLHGEEYRSSLAIYVQRMEKLQSTLHNDLRVVRLKRERDTLLQRTAGVAAICLLLTLWLVVLTRRRREEEQLRNAQTEELLTSISSVLIGVDTDGRVTNWNAAAESVLGISASQAIGRPFRHCGIRWEWPPILEGITACVEQNRPIRLKPISYEHTSGRNGTLGATLNPVAPGSSAKTSFLLLAADLTEHKVLEDQLLQAQKLESVGQLAAGIAHEINTPTQYVGDNTRFLQEAFGEVLQLTKNIEELTRKAGNEAGTPELATKINEAMKKVDLKYLTAEIPRATQEALEGIERVTKIVRAMKEFSHPMREKTAIDINRAIESTITVARNEWKYVAEMITDLDPELPPVTCLPGGFNQVILNLIVNAAHAITEVVGADSSTKGTITVSTKRVKDWAEIRIADTGTGIPEEIRGKIFDPFFTTKAVGKGTGQGLSLVHSMVVHKHGGKISVESTVGRGTTFLIQLPLEDPTADVEEHAA